ncbi:response regulator [Methylobrevis albus]|uniref:Response regulator n=1 Tax=Methylobrevis albus TaxID=2793297 RepID=A0A931I3C7_9HYPH|nr:response regulator [Methylobrevis albus]MBH0238548.1 response regulator [Methylobrevis albus]
MQGPVDQHRDVAGSQPALRRLVAVEAGVAPPPRRKIAVLCVEDDPEDVFLLRRFLADMPFHAAEVVFAATVDEARHRLSEGRFDVCLCDFWLGRETTIPLIDELRLSLSGCPVVLMSTLENDDIELIGRRSGSCGFIGKGELSAAALDRILSTILPDTARAATATGEEGVGPWLRALLRSLDRMHAASTLALVAPVRPSDRLVSQILLDIETDSAELRRDIIGRLLAVEKAARARAEHVVFDVVPQLGAAVDAVLAQIGPDGAGKLGFLLPRLPIGVQGNPALFADLLQGFLTEVVDSVGRGFDVALEPAIRNESFVLTVRVVALPTGAAFGDRDASAGADPHHEARLEAVVGVRRLIVETLAGACGGFAEFGEAGGMPFARMTVPLRAA